MGAERSCVVCGQVGSKEGLLRFVYLAHAEGLPLVEEIFSAKLWRSIELDLAQEKPGRGAYCHRDKSCLFDRKLFPRLCMSLFCVKQKKKVVVKRLLAVIAKESGNLLRDKVEQAKLEIAGRKKISSLAVWLDEMLSHLKVSAEKQAVDKKIRL